MADYTDGSLFSCSPNSKYPYSFLHSFFHLTYFINAHTLKYQIQSTPMRPGSDDKGSFYPSIDQMWEMELNGKVPSGKSKVVSPVGSLDNWYNKANNYWEKTQPSYNGVLGGFGNLSSLDIQFSLKFLLEHFKNNPTAVRERVIDCGAGIGRIAKQLLCQVYKTVDVIDQCQNFIQKSKEILSGKKIGHFYAQGLQQFEFQEKYDCIWIQWVISHLTDDDLVKFLIKAKGALNQNGFIVLKENHCKLGFLVDKEDFSVTRSQEIFFPLFMRAGLKVVKDQKQMNWPADLLEVRMYLLQ